MKKTYVVPESRVINLGMCNILASSMGKYAYYCPYIPETECELYDEFVVRKIGVNKGCLKQTTSGKSFMIADVHCPYKKGCEDYKLFCNIMNDKQRL